MIPDENPYGSIEHAMRVVGKLGSSSVPKRLGQAQAMLYAIRDQDKRLTEVQDVAEIIRSCAITLMHVSAALDKAGGKKSTHYG
jgi:hypothetical protein